MSSTSENIQKAFGGGRGSQKFSVGGVTSKPFEEALKKPSPSDDIQKTLGRGRGSQKFSAGGVTSKPPPSDGLQKTLGRGRGSQKISVGGVTSKPYQEASNKTSTSSSSESTSQWSSYEEDSNSSNNLNCESTTESLPAVSQNQVVENSEMFEVSGASNMWDHLKFISRNKGPSFVTAFKRKQQLDNLNDSLKILKLDDLNLHPQAPEGLYAQNELAAHPETHRGANENLKNEVEVKNLEVDGQNMLETYPNLPTPVKTCDQFSYSSGIADKNMLVTYPYHQAPEDSKATASATSAEVQNMLETYPKRSTPEEEATSNDVDDQNMLETYPNLATPNEAGNNVPVASTVPGSGVVSVLLNQLSEVRAPQSLFTLGNSSEGRGSVTRSHEFAFPEQIDPCKVAKLGLTDAKTKTQPQD